jgi:hypothetical protein
VTHEGLPRLQVLQEICAYTKVVVSTGGGTVNSKANWVRRLPGLQALGTPGGALEAASSAHHTVWRAPQTLAALRTASGFERTLKASRAKGSTGVLRTGAREPLPAQHHVQPPPLRSQTVSGLTR